MGTLNEGDKLQFELEVDRRGKYAAVPGFLRFGGGAWAMWRPIWCSARLPSRPGPTADSIRPIGLIIPSRGRSHATGMTKAEWGSVLLFGRSCPPPPSPPRVDHAPGMILNGRGPFIPMRPGGGGLPVCWQCRSTGVQRIRKLPGRARPLPAPRLS
ncbi:hypothetical protein WR25_03023 [Diploscapter pachys]|uniref:Uncharacterized protein n=1 Tax=Diploscapter pachys TaxID=2018661 RepID=A0A2A2M4Y3_9BILA|nr:hypothetical protein WR25_03023 [Diploscapter pachys]